MGTSKSRKFRRDACGHPLPPASFRYAPSSVWEEGCGRLSLSAFYIPGGRNFLTSSTFTPEMELAPAAEHSPLEMAAAASSKARCSDVT